MKTYSVRDSVVRNLGAFNPVTVQTIIPSVDGWPGPSDVVILAPGEWLEIVEHGSPESWSKAVKMDTARAALRELLHKAEHAQRSEIAPNVELLSPGYVQEICISGLN